MPRSVAAAPPPATPTPVHLPAGHTVATHASGPASPGTRATSVSDRTTGAEEPGSPQRSESSAEAAGLDYDKAFTGASGDDDVARFSACVARLAERDDIERNDAVLELIRTHVHQLVACLVRRRPADLALAERAIRGLWRNADLVLLDDYFFSSRRSKLTWLLTLAEPHDVAHRFRLLLQFFSPKGRYEPPDSAFGAAAVAFPEDAGVFARAGLFHPIEAYRRYAVETVPLADIWTVVAFPCTPAAALLTILERLARSDVADDYRKVFFDCTARTLATATGALQLRAARRILDQFYQFEFFMEDEYFTRLNALSAIVCNREELSGIQSPLFSHSEKRLREERARVGSRLSRDPDFSGIPLTVQRKLARDGQYLYLFVRHDDVRIARETIPHITTPARIDRVLQTPRVHPLVLADLGHRSHLRTSYGARLAFLKQQKVPAGLARPLLAQVRPEDLRQLAVAHDINPDVVALAGRELRRREGGPRHRR